MIRLVASIFSLLLGIGVLLVGNGFLGTLLGLRATLEHFSQMTTGLIMSAYFCGFIAGAYLCPPLINRVGHIRAFAAMAAVASVSVLLHPLIVQPLVWGVLRFVTGLCAVGLYMVIESWLNSRASNQQRGQVFAVYMTVTLFAMAGGQFLLLFNGVDGVVPFAIVTILFSLGLVPVALTRVLEPLPIATPALRLRYLIRRAPVGVLGTLIAGLLLGAFWGMGAVFAVRIGLADHWIAGFMGAAILGGALLQLPIGRLSDRRDRRAVLIGVSLAAACCAAGAYLAIGYRAAPGLAACMFFYGGFTFPIYAISVAHMNDQLAAAEILDASSGLLMTYGIGAAVGPTAAGALMSVFGARALLLYLAVLVLVLAAGTRYLMLRRPMAEAQHKGEFVPMVRTSQAALEMLPEAELAPELDLDPH